MYDYSLPSWKRICILVWRLLLFFIISIFAIETVAWNCINYFDLTTKDNLKEDFTILSSFYIRFCHFRVLKIEEIAGRKLRLVKLTSKYLKIPWQNLQSGIYTTARYNQKAVYIPVQDWIFHLYNETRRTLVYKPSWGQTEYVNKVVHVPLLRSI